ncbi:hypothetical protein C7G91_04835 [Acinetobacter nosocomialis]|uniref:hypothetical protein n=1 Tax=Acinetobacter nosocomialis TaxID=106654 RepID=UPI000D0B101C|nr:hypothetical protein [Acinetobacter nosocomialis]PSE43965.1 hypothetical protein C7G97_12025 [Acinetobacter nosocomialis]PSE85356.1 hypothetical protein C7G91_04835 [Acinetobacter nosocomialis]
MTDLNKEREAFELFELNKRPCATPASLFERFDSNDLGEDEQHYVGRYVDSYMQEKWELWQKAKAQAVPEGYVLVPKEIPDSVVSYLENSGFHWGDGTRDHYTPIYSLMVEVASESGAEG